MPNKKLTQVGMHRVLWKLLKDCGGKVVIPENLIDRPSPEDAVQIQYDPSIKSFVLECIKVRPDAKKVKSSIIQLPGNLN